MDSKHNVTPVHSSTESTSEGEHVVAIDEESGRYELALEVASQASVHAKTYDSLKLKFAGMPSVLTWLEHSIAAFKEKSFTPKQVAKARRLDEELACEYEYDSADVHITLICWCQAH
jgi:predicted dinucleotide-utilizing enzyme